ncbi:hypothetical protein LBMAG53_00360 [Planctomycetota bacterium]|nr:hypothetical protein LBMAG53_00360 [Planctomycetota bacterium]
MPDAPTIDAAAAPRRTPWLIIIGIAAVLVFWVVLVTFINLPPPPAHPALPGLDDPAKRAVAVGQLAKDKFVPIKERIRELAKDGDPAVRTAAAGYLGALAEPADATLLRAMVEDGNATVRSAVATALGACWDGEDSGRGLRVLLADKEPAVRNHAALALSGHLDDAKALDDVVRALATAEPGLSEQLISALAAHWKVPAHRPALASGAADALTGLPDPAQREALAKAFGRFADISAVPMLLRRVEGELVSRYQPKVIKPAVQEGLVLALSGLGEGIAEPLCKLAVVEEAETTVEDIAFQALSRVGAKAAPALAAALGQARFHQDPVKTVRWVGLLTSWKPAAASVAPILANLVLQGEPALVSAAEALAKASGATLPPAAPSAGALPRLGPTGLEVGKALPAGPLPATAIIRAELADAVEAIGRKNTLTVELLRRDGQWLPAAEGHGINKRQHLVQVTPTSDGVSLKVAVLDDQWIQGGWGEYAVTLAADGSGGTWTGSYNGLPFQGSVKTRAYPLPTITAPAPIQPGEHPRILWRADELESIRARARHPVGRQILAQIGQRLTQQRLAYRTKLDHVTNWTSGMDAAIGHAVLALVFDDPVQRERATALFLPRAETPPYGGEHGEVLVPQIPYLSLGFDIVHPLLDAEQRAMSARLVRNNAIWAWNVEEGGMGNMARTYAEHGLPALVLLGETGPLTMKEPQSSGPLVIGKTITLSPSEAMAPRNRYSPSEFIPDWLVVGPLPRGLADPVAALGADAPLPAAGSNLTLDGRSFLVAPLPDEARKSSAKLKDQGQYLAPPQAAEGDRALLLCLLDVSEESGCVPDFKHLMGANPRIWIDGQLVEPDAAILLPPGVHRVAVEVRGTCVPRFIEAPARSRIGAAARYQVLKARFDAAKATWNKEQAYGDLALMIRQCRSGLRQTCRNQVEAERQYSPEQWQEKGNSNFGFGSSWLFLGPLHRLLGSTGDPDPWHSLATRWIRPVIKDAHPLVSSQALARELSFGLMAATEEQRKLMAKEIRADWLPNGLQPMGCLELAATFANFPYEVE